MWPSHNLFPLVKTSESLLPWSSKSVDNFLLHMYQRVKLHHPMICACSIGDKSLMIPSNLRDFPFPSALLALLLSVYLAITVHV